MNALETISRAGKTVIRRPHKPENGIQFPGPLPSFGEDLALCALGLAGSISIAMGIYSVAEKLAEWMAS